MDLAGRLTLPDDTEAILWDMDGVLLDSLALDYALCNQLLQAIVDPAARVGRAAIRTFFPFDLPEFWRRILGTIAVEDADDGRREGWLARLVEAHEAARESAVLDLNPGVDEVLADARRAGLKLAVVSNNPTNQVREVLARHHNLLERFDDVLGNDLKGAAKKPAPDPYLFAARALGVPPGRCAVVEDSLLGVQAGRAAGCYTVGVATGAATFEALDGSPFVDRAYLRFDRNVVALRPGPVTEKRIDTPNEFVSHMVEHLAWRLGCAVDVRWNNADWEALGRALGAVIAGFPRRTDSSAALGMIDDGSAEVRVAAAGAGKGELVLKSASTIDLDWYLALRCEQLATGGPLVALLRGIAGALPARIEVAVCSVEDPHHTWEGVFRTLGVALKRMLADAPAPPAASETSAPEGKPVGNWTVVRRSTEGAEVRRASAETEVRALVDYARGYQAPACRFDVSDSIQVDGLADLLDALARAAGFRLEVDFRATRISSSHVVMEDAGMVLGRALKEVLVERMQHWGVNGAGSSVASPEDLDRDAIRVGLSVEGRKFWKFVPFATSYDAFRRAFLIGHTVGRGLFSEDLDDFIDGFTGGLTGSLVVHVAGPVAPEDGWPLVFRGIGRALAETMERNPARKGVAPGVKATLD